MFYPARSAADFARAQRAGKIASYIVVEGGVGLENSLSPLRIWHAAGARMLIPCHNETLDWVDSATDAPRHNGFNAFGRAVIGECQSARHDRRRRACVARRHPPPARRFRGADPAVALQRLRAVRPSAQRARRRAEAAEGERRRGAGDLRAGLRLAGFAQLAQEARSTPTARRRWSPTSKRGSRRSKRATARRRA